MVEMVVCLVHSLVSAFRANGPVGSDWGGEEKGWFNRRYHHPLIHDTRHIQKHCRWHLLVLLAESKLRTLAL